MNKSKNDESKVYEEYVYVIGINFEYCAVPAPPRAAA